MDFPARDTFQIVRKKIVQAKGNKQVIEVNLALKKAKA
jgi:hypothetical protein